MELTVFKVKYKAMKGHVFVMCGALAIDMSSVMMCNMTEIINRTYKNDSNMKRCRDRMKEISLPKPNPEVRDNRVTPSHDLVDAKIL